MIVCANLLRHFISRSLFVRHDFLDVLLMTLPICNQGFNTLFSVFFLCFNQCDLSAILVDLSNLIVNKDFLILDYFLTLFNCVLESRASDLQRCKEIFFVILPNVCSHIVRDLSRISISFRSVYLLIIVLFY